MIGAGSTGAEPVRALIASEHGGVLVMVALALPVLLLFAAFVIDIGNWFAHHRHLQTQADAAVLAAAGEYRVPCDVETDASIESVARFYSGESATGYNQQLGSTPPEEVHFVLNSRNYHENSGPVDDTVVEGSPCEAGMVDVKMTETDLPLFLRLAGLFSNVDYINTHARVEFFQRTRFSGGLPFGVPDQNPRSGRVIFIDEASGEQLGSRPLARNGVEGDLAIWDNSADPFPLTVDRERIGVRVAFGGADSTTCGDPLVECYDLDDPNLGLLRVRGYSLARSGAQPNEPLPRNVYLMPGTCSDPYFTQTASGCTIGVHAEVDFGPCDSSGGLPDVGAKLTARVGGTDYALDPVSCPAGTSTSEWETSGAPIPVGAAAGPIPIELRWEETKGTVGSNACKTGGGNGCKASFGPVHRTYSAVDSRSGPIRAAQLWEDGSAWANSFEACSSATPECTYDVVAKVGIDLSLRENAESVDEEPVALRFAAGQGSRNQALDCDLNMTLRDEITFGCPHQFTINQGTACPTKANLWGLPEPWDCVGVQTGDATGQLWQGMNLRIHGAQQPTSCVSPSNWAEFPNLPDGDPRIVHLFITPFGVFDTQGSTDTVPISDFAVFYVTGWHDSQSVCPSDDPAPDKSIVGHFIKYVEAFNDGSAGEEHCELSELGSCVAVMTQ